MNEDRLKQLIANKYINVQKHPTADLFIYNYTHKCQFEKVWTEETMACRGLIRDSKRNVVARPFTKFFNLEEMTELPQEPFGVYEKLDGSLGILYWVGDTPYVATRGSFKSEQAIEGTKMLHERKDIWHLFHKDRTYLFEIIYPENKIVVDYKGFRGLILLAIVDTATGKDCQIPTNFPMPVATYYPLVNSIEKLKELEEDNKEGFVIRFQGGMRVKVKFNEYVRLHRLICGITERRIWDILRHKGDVIELLERVPDEFYQWVKQCTAKLLEEFLNIETHADYCLMKVKDLPRKEAAMILQQEKPIIRSVVFLLLDGKDYKDVIWKSLKPAADKPFKIEV